MAQNEGGRTCVQRYIYRGRHGAAHTHTCTCTYPHKLHSTVLYLCSLTHSSPIFSLTSTHLTRRRKSPVAHSSWSWLIFCSLMPSPAVRLCVPGESRHSCCGDLIKSGSNWWFCPHALEPQDPTGVLTQARSPQTLSTPPRHPLNTDSSSEKSKHTLCFIKKCVPPGRFLMIFWSWSSCHWTLKTIFHVDLHHLASSFLQKEPGLA